MYCLTDQAAIREQQTRNSFGPRWHSGQGAVLQIGRSLVRSQMVTLEFFIDI